MKVTTFRLSALVSSYFHAISATENGNFDNDNFDNNNAAAAASEGTSESLEFMSTAGAYDNSGPQARSSYTVRTMIWNLCLRNDICSASVHKKLNSKDFLAFLIDYGCNCYPSSAALPATPDQRKTWYHHTFLGAPVDDLDQACLDASENYKCMLMDYDNGSIEQDGKHGCYNGQAYNYFIDDNNQVQCGTKKNIDYKQGKSANDCRLAACQIERDFAYRALEIMQYDPVSFIENNVGKRNYCPKSTNRKSIVTTIDRDACCGNFPQRSPFRSMVQECCSDGSTASVGRCSL